VKAFDSQTIADMRAQCSIGQIGLLLAIQSIKKEKWFPPGSFTPTKTEEIHASKIEAIWRLLMFYSLLVWLFAKPKGRPSKPGAFLETAYIAIVILILMTLASCGG